MPIPSSEFDLHSCLDPQALLDLKLELGKDEDTAQVHVYNGGVTISEEDKTTTVTADGKVINKTTDGVVLSKTGDDDESDGDGNKKGKRTKLGLEEE